MLGFKLIHGDEKDPMSDRRTNTLDTRSSEGIPRSLYCVGMDLLFLKHYATRNSLRIGTFSHWTN